MKTLSKWVVRLALAAAIGLAYYAELHADHRGHDPGAAVPLPSQPPARLLADAPLPDQLARGLVVIQYRTEHLRIAPVFGSAALDVSPRIGHMHVTVDDAPWHWADASGEPLIIQGLLPGAAPCADRARRPGAQSHRPPDSRVRDPAA